MYTFCHQKVHFLWCTFQKHLSMGKRHFQNMILRLKQFLSLSSFIWHSWYRGVNVSILQNYTSFQDQITRAESQKTFKFFHYHLNLFICCKTKLKIQFIFYRMSCFTEWSFYIEKNFLKIIKFFNKGIQIFILFEKKRFLLRKIKFL